MKVKGKLLEQMTLELSPELETQIERAARQHGVDAPSLAIETLQRAFGGEPETKPRETRSFGFLRGKISSSDAFLEERHAETEREMRKESGA